MRNISLIAVFFVSFFSLLFSSCVSTKQFTYLQGRFDTAQLSQVKVMEPIFQRGDLLSIVVYSDNPQATALFNQAATNSQTQMGVGMSSGGAGSGSGGASGGGGIGGGSPAATTSGGGSGYQIDGRGNIEFPGLGRMHIEGLTRDQLRDTLDMRLKDYLKHPYYTIRFLNNRVTVLGEVVRPGVFSMPSDHVSLLEALSMAGDMTFFGRRDSILIIRETNGKREFARLDITKPAILGSPYFYLQQNDVVIVEATKKKIAANDQTTIRNLSIVTSILTLGVLIVTLIRNH